MTLSGHVELFLLRLVFLDDIQVPHDFSGLRSHGMTVVDSARKVRGQCAQVYHSHIMYFTRPALPELALT